VRAVCASLEEKTALREVTIRKSALGGRGQIGAGEYPRMTYVLSVATNRTLDLASTVPPELANVVRLCLRGKGYSVAGIGGHLDFRGYRQCRFSVCDRRWPKWCGVSRKRLCGLTAVTLCAQSRHHFAATASATRCVEGACESYVFLPRMKLPHKLRCPSSMRRNVPVVNGNPDGAAPMGRRHPARKMLAGVRRRSMRRGIARWRRRESSGSFVGRRPR
jgi:hypothetical protein